jgi:ComF family protein
MKWTEFALARLYPPTCLLCRAAGAAGLDLCAGCAGDLPSIAIGCDRCGVPLPQPGTCGRCLQHPPPVARIITPFRYQPPLDALIKGFKFTGRLSSGRLLRELLLRALLHRPLDLPDLIVPVPLHPRRLGERGFNQATELARGLGRGLAVPVDRRVCRRVRATAVQSQLPSDERRKNVRGAFEVVRPLAGPRVAIVDDVITTGSTVFELARALRKAGATDVQVWALARAGHD